MGKKEPRSPIKNRRTGDDRRKINDPNYEGAERRRGKDRRFWKDRRSS